MPRVSCDIPQHHRSSGGSASIPWGLLAIVAGVAVVGTSTAFARTMHDVMILVIGVCVVLAAAALSVTALLLHHHRTLRIRLAETRRPVQIHTTAQYVPPVTTARRPAVAPGVPDITSVGRSRKRAPVASTPIERMPIERRRP